MALKGIKVLDFCRFQNGPHATALLADLGATVVKVEEPGIGDGGRAQVLRAGTGGPSPGKGEGFNGYNEHLNRGKKSIELDLKAPGAKLVMEKLIAWCDVLTENFKAGTMDQIGWGYETCKKINPMIIYCANSGFGPDGEYSNRGSFDTIAQGMSGAMVETGGGPSHTPRTVNWGAADQVGAMSFGFHIVAAIAARERQGIGQKVECSQLGAFIQLQGITNVPAWNTGKQRDNGRLGDEIMAAGTPLSYYQGNDGKWFTVAQSVIPSHYARFCKAVGLDRLLQDERTKDGATAGKSANRAYFRDIIVEHFKGNTAKHWSDLIGPTGVPTGLVLNYEEVASSPHIRENNYVVDVEHPVFGTVTTTGVPAKYSGTPWEKIGIAPDLGEHTDEVLKDIVGLSDTEIQTLKRDHATTPDSSKGYREPIWMARHKWKKPRAKL